MRTIITLLELALLSQLVQSATLNLFRSADSPSIKLRFNTPEEVEEHTFTKSVPLSKQIHTGKKVIKYSSNDNSDRV
jgi:hypothetical protein